MTDDGWGMIQKVDGLSGWCTRALFVPISQAYPEIMYQRLNEGIIYFRKQVNKPRKAIVHFINVFLRDNHFESLVTPGDANGFLYSRTTSQFLEEFGMDVAINGDLYSYLGSSRTSSVDGSAQEYVQPNGFAASKGVIYSKRKGPTFFISPYNYGTFMLPKGSVYNAISGERLIVMDGKASEELHNDAPTARTAIGLTKDCKVLILMVVDGKQPDHSEGLSEKEIADQMVDVGAWWAMLLDSGGSSTLVVKGVDGQPKVINSPIDKDVPGTERAVANHFGVQIVKSSGRMTTINRMFGGLKKNKEGAKG
jgi:hypothetical protein